MDNEFDSVIDDGLDDDEEAEDRRRVELLAELECLGEVQCVSCQRPLCGHAYVICVAAGFKTTPRCVGCIADGYGRTQSEFLADAFRYIRRHPCYWNGWQWANRHEGYVQSEVDDDHLIEKRPSSTLLERPTCLWPDGSPPEAALITDSHELRPEAELKPDTVWDAGDMSCGDLVLELRLRMKRLQAGQLMALTARDPGAPQDIPAWCRLTRHILVAVAHPHYWIQRRAD